MADPSPAPAELQEFDLSLKLQQHFAAELPPIQGIGNLGNFSLGRTFRSAPLGSCVTSKTRALRVPRRSQAAAFSLAFPWGELGLKSSYSAVLHFRRIAHKQGPAPGYAKRVPGLQSSPQAPGGRQLFQADLRGFRLAAIAPHARGQRMLNAP